MINSNSALKPVLDVMDDLYNNLRDSRLNTETLEINKSEIVALSHFFQCSKEQAIFLGLMLFRHLNDEAPSVKELISHLGLNLSYALHINKTLDPLVKKEWLTPKQDLRYYPFTGYQISKKLIHSVIMMDWTHMKEKPIQNSLELLEQFGTYLSARKNRQINFDKLTERSYHLITQNDKLDLPAFLLELDFDPSDCTLFLYLCFQHYNGQEFINLDCIMNDLCLSLKDQYALRSSIKSHKHIFLEHELIEVKEAGMLDCADSLVLTPEAIRQFSKLEGTPAKKFESKFLIEISPDQIKEKKLVYNDKEGGILTRMGRVLSSEDFERVTECMENKGMRPGLTVLLYGHPGTGKTETVHQLARQCGRTILMADASNLRDKWLGQSEKNVRDLFKDYKKSMTHYDEVPILLFNEADSIMTKRRPISDKIDQMENTLQNILLQELENFEGIFIATTNLENNLDPAFERRLLFKVKFEQPEVSVRTKLWMQKLPDLPVSLAKRIAERYILSGGQIDNICKKIQMDSLFDPGVQLTWEYVTELIRHENCLQKGSNKERHPIGFKIQSYDAVS